MNSLTTPWRSCNAQQLPTSAAASPAKADWTLWMLWTCIQPLIVIIFQILNLTKKRSSLLLLALQGAEPRVDRTYTLLRDGLHVTTNRPARSNVQGVDVST